MKPKVLCVWGTRPEAIKMAPVVLALRREERLTTRTCVTAQHRDLLDQALKALGVRPDIDLDCMRPAQTLEGSAARILEETSRVFKTESPDLVLVQGDTTTAFAASVAAFYRRVPVGHIEAGLRTHDPLQPFPEEMNRVLADGLASLHFAPTKLAKENLLAEGIGEDRILVTGNTIVDSLKFLLPRLKGPKDPTVRHVLASEGRVLLVTAHRRESFGPGLESVCRALLSVAGKHPGVRLLYPVHPNPEVDSVARKRLRHPRIFLAPPLDYSDFLQVMRRAYLILTDSGGVQEEAPTLHKPVIVLREVTERPEALKAGAALLAGTDERRICRAVDRVLTDSALYRRMASVPNPFGDGRSAGRIAKAVLHHFGLGKAPADWKG